MTGGPHSVLDPLCCDNILRFCAAPRYVKLKIAAWRSSFWCGPETVVALTSTPHKLEVASPGFSALEGGQRDIRKHCPILAGV